MWLKRDTMMRSHPFEVEFQLSEGQLHFATTSQRFLIFRQAALILQGFDFLFTDFTISQF